MSNSAFWQMVFPQHFEHCDENRPRIVQCLTSELLRDELDRFRIVYEAQKVEPKRSRCQIGIVSGFNRKPRLTADFCGFLKLRFFARPSARYDIRTTVCSCSSRLKETTKKASASRSRSSQRPRFSHSATPTRGKSSFPHRNASAPTRRIPVTARNNRHRNALELSRKHESKRQRKRTRLCPTRERPTLLRRARHGAQLPRRLAMRFH